MCQRFLQHRCDCATKPDAQETGSAVAKGHAIGPYRAWLSEWLASAEAKEVNDISLKWSMGIAAWNSIKEEKGA